MKADSLSNLRAGGCFTSATIRQRDPIGRPTSGRGRMLPLTTQSTAEARSRPGRTPAAIPSSQVSEDTIVNLSEVFKMLSDRSRLKILLALAQSGAMNVTSLRGLLAQTQPKVSQPAVSHHLALLRGARLVRCERQGKECHYRLDSAKVRDLLEQVFSEVGNSNRQIQFEDVSLSLKRR